MRPPSDNSNNNCYLKNNNNSNSNNGGKTIDQQLAEAGHLSGRQAPNNNGPNNQPVAGNVFNFNFNYKPRPQPPPLPPVGRRLESNQVATGGSPHALQHLASQQQQQQQQPQPLQSSPGGAKMLAADKAGQLVPLIPGLLDESLLRTGSFAFNSQLVRFDKLKVLGNVYVNRINGRPLRESYLFKSGLDKGPGGPNYALTKPNYGQFNGASKRQLDVGGGSESQASEGAQKSNPAGGKEQQQQAGELHLKLIGCSSSSSSNKRGPTMCAGS